MREKKKKIGKNFKTILAPSLFTLGAGRPLSPVSPLRGERSQTTTDLWKDSQGGPETKIAEVSVGWVTKEAHPTTKRLAYLSLQRKTKHAEVSELTTKPVVTVGSQDTFTGKQRPARCNGYETKALDESFNRDNPGNEWASPTNGGCVPVNGIRASVLKSLRLIPDPFTNKAAVALSGETLKCQEKAAPMEKIKSGGFYDRDHRDNR